MDRIELTLGQSFRSRGSPASPITPATSPAPAPLVLSREAEAAGLLSLAESYERNRLVAQAKQRAQRVVQEFSDTKAAPKAREMLKRLESPR